jgi:outer membrane immunogenic protein
MQAKFRLSRPAAALFVVGLLGAAPAYAADVVQQEPPPGAPVEVPPVASWAGPYAGVSLGYGFSGTVTPVTGDIDTDGFVGGIFGGYNFQDGMFVYGVEGDVNYSHFTGSNAAATSASTGFDGSLRGRLGVAVTDDVLLYGTAGGALEHLKVSDPTGSDSNTMGGWTAGGGVDVKLTEQVFGRVEYRYTDLGSADFNTGTGPQSIDNSQSRVTFGIGMKF